MVRKDLPQIHFYDQDFVDIYDQSWARMADFWFDGTEENGFEGRFFCKPESGTIDQFDSCMAVFFLVYSNRQYSAQAQLDAFYAKQEDNGAIRASYDLKTGKPKKAKTNPEMIGPPLFAWAEYNLYHKIGNKKRIKEILPLLQKYYEWVDKTFKDEEGMYVVPLEATGMLNSPREAGYYFVDFNAQMALSALYISELADILNDKDIAFQYKRNYFSLKTRLNTRMWDEEAGIYMDLNKEGERIGVKTIAGFWPMLAETPNEAKFDRLKAHLRNHETFGTENPFPSLSADSPEFSEDGNGYRGSVFPPYTFMIIKALEKYGAYSLARECSIRHLYYMLDTLHPEGGDAGNIWEAYRPTKDGPASWEGNDQFPRPMHLSYAALSTITLMIENIVGLYISLPRKTVDWIVPTLDVMGIEGLNLKRNVITIRTNKTARGWEIRLESEKLYYFTIDVLGQTRKTLPIPSGKCSMLVDKL